MKRRELLKRIGQLAVVVTSARFISASSSSPRLATVRQMTQEWPARLWGCRNDRGSTLIYFGDNPAFEVKYKRGDWDIRERELTSSEYSELQRYKDKLDPRVPQRVGTALGKGDLRLRGWVYNGRYPNEWRMSAESI